MADEVDVFILQPGAEQRTGDHGEGHLHQLRIDVDGAETDLLVEVASESASESCMIDGERVQLLAIEALLDETPLVAPGFAMGGKQTFTQEVAHSLHLDLGLLVVLPVGLQHVLNDGRIDGDNGFLQPAEIDPESVTELLVVLRQNPHRVAGHGARVGEAAKA